MSPRPPLGVQESAGVLEMIGHAAEQGHTGMIVIAHNLQHVFHDCSRILVMRQGRLVVWRRACQERAATTSPSDGR